MSLFCKPASAAALAILLCTPLAASGRPDNVLHDGAAPSDTLVSAPAPPPAEAGLPGMEPPATTPAPLGIPAPAPFMERMTAPTTVEFSRSIHAPGFITGWNGGALTGSVSSTDLPGLMAIEQGGFMVTQQFGRFTASAYTEAIKYGFFRGFRTSWGFGGELTYQANDRLSFTVFGSYYTSPGPMSPSMAGFARIPTFGGYADWLISDRWGVKVGAQSYRSMMTGRWETQPIVAPYYRIAPNANIGVDVGGILYNLLKGSSGSYRRANPTLAPDIPSINDRF